MLKDITLGQFYPGASPIHRADPRTKVLLGIVYIVSLFLVKNIYGFVFCTALLVGAVFVSRIPLRTVLAGIKPLLFVIVFTSLINIFWTKGDTLLVEWRFVRIYREGLLTAAFMALRIVLLVVGTSMFLTYTTTPISLTNALESLLSPLKVLHVKVDEFAMMMSTALRFIPTLIEDTDRIMDAQRARGASFSSGGLIQKAKALIPILIPLFVCAFKHADDLSVAMECRCYHGGEGRTRLHALRYGKIDLLWAFCAAFLVCGVILLNRVSCGFTL